MPKPKDDEMKVRVTAGMKAEFEALAESRDVPVSQLAREALNDYLAKQRANPSSTVAEKTARILKAVRKAHSKPSSPASKPSQPHLE